MSFFHLKVHDMTRQLFVQLQNEADIVEIIKIYENKTAQQLKQCGISKYTYNSLQVHTHRSLNVENTYNNLLC